MGASKRWIALLLTAALFLPLLTGAALAAGEEAVDGDRPKEQESGAFSGVRFLGIQDGEGVPLEYLETTVDPATNVPVALYRPRDSSSAANGTYYARAAYILQDQEIAPGEVGQYIECVVTGGMTWAQAQAVLTNDPSRDIQEQLFGMAGYGADYSEGLVITVFEQDGGAYCQGFRVVPRGEEPGVEPEAPESGGDPSLDVPGAQLYVSGINDAERTEGGMPLREVLLTEDNGYACEIFFANIGREELTGLTVELDEAAGRTLKLDEGTIPAERLAGFTTTEPDGGMIRLLPADGLDETGFHEIGGVITFRSGNGGEQRIMLTGVVGEPRITAADLPNGERSVPYSGIILTNSGYTGERLTFTAVGLPGGMTVSSDGRITGIPTEAGTFHVRITMTYAAGETELSDTKERTLVIDAGGEVSGVNGEDPGDFWDGPDGGDGAGSAGSGGPGGVPSGPGQPAAEESAAEIEVLGAQEIEALSAAEESAHVPKTGDDSALPVLVALLGLFTLGAAVCALYGLRPAGKRNDG